MYEKVAIGYSTVKKWAPRMKGEEQEPALNDLQNKQRSAKKKEVQKSAFSWQSHGDCVLGR